MPTCTNCRCRTGSMSPSVSSRKECSMRIWHQTSVPASLDSVYTLQKLTSKHGSTAQGHERRRHTTRKAPKLLVEATEETVQGLRLATTLCCIRLPLRAPRVSLDAREVLRLRASKTATLYTCQRKAMALGTGRSRQRASEDLDKRHHKVCIFHKNGERCTAACGDCAA